ncbi:MAG: M28 family peptidase [Flavisolibacter sp.]
MKQLLIFLLVFSTFNAFSQKNDKPEKFAKTITPEELRKQLYIVAGPEMEGRETATPGQKKAAAYIENEFKQIGLLPGVNGSYQLYYNVYQDSLLTSNLEVNGKSFEADKDFNPSVSNVTAELRFSEVVLIGSNASDSIKNSNLAGKLVMVISSSPTSGRGMRGGLFGALITKGVAGIIIVSPGYPRTSPSSRTGNNTVSLFKRSLTPQIYTISESVAKAIIGDDYDNAKSNTSQVKTYSSEILLQTAKATRTLQSSDVVGILPGTDLKDQYVVISAHYDHLGKRDNLIYYGADDDGSGTVSVLELARAFSKAKIAGKGPRRSIVFLANSGEEEGLWGSDYYTSHPSFPLSQTTVDLNIDMIGRIDPNRKNGDSTNYVYVVGDDKLSSDLHSISEAENKKYTKLELDYKFNDPNDKDRIYYRSDHYNFAKHGVPIIFYFDGIHADYHKPSDTPDKINYNLMAKRAQLVFYTAWDMANRNDLLRRDIPLDKTVYTR